MNLDDGQTLDSGLFLDAGAGTFTPGTATLALAAFAPTVTAGGAGPVVTPGTATLALAALVPTVAVVVADLPVLAVRIDWNRDGDFSDSGETVTADVLSVAHPITWTRGRSADFSAEAQGAAEFTLRNDDGRYNTGTLLPGLPVHIYATHSAVDYPLFYGFIERVTPDPRERTVTVTCYDVLRRMAETDVVVPSNTYAAYSARTMRRAVLEDFERGTRNLIANPSFETNTTGWTQSGTSLTRTATDAAPGAGSAYGAFIAAGADQRAYVYARLAPIYFEGEVYRFSVYLKVASGTETWKVGLGTTLGADANERSVVVTTSWQRFTATYTMTADQTGSGANPLVAWVESTTAGTVRIDAAAITRGQALYPWSDTGTGRWPNWVGNGDFEGANVADGWTNAIRNFVSNPSFETNTTGWVATGIGSFVTAVSSVTRIASNPAFGTACAEVISSASGQGVGIEMNATGGTFKAGATYDFGITIRTTSGVTTGTVGMGAVGSGDSSETAYAGVGTLYSNIYGSWTPSADRAASVYFYVKVNSAVTFRIDGAYVYLRTNVGAVNRYWDTGPGGGGINPTSIATTGPGVYGGGTMVVTTPATANTGVIYNFAHYGPMFVMGQQYVLSLWVYPSSSMPYKVGIGADKADGTWDEASTTGTATANVWTQITRTWTPSADRNSDTALEAVTFVYQTDATARDFRVDGVRVIPGGTADAFEMTHWDLDMNAGGEVADRYLATASFSGSALSALSTLNDLTLTRHWISPTSAAPWYTYQTSDREQYALASSAETYDDDLHDMAQSDIDGASVVNVVPVSYASGIEYYSDETSVATYGPRPASSINGTEFFSDRTVPDIIGPALIARYGVPRARPTITVQNRWPSIFVRELDDLVTLNFNRLGITGTEYLVLSLTVRVSDGGHMWTATYVLEERA